MKGRISIVLLGLALVFGMIAASCDNGAYPTLDTKDVSTQFAYDATGDNLTPKTDGSYGSVGTTAGKATPITGDDLFKLLQIKVDNPDGTRTFVNQYVLGRVAAVAGDEVRTKYAGMPIIINNPVLTTVSRDVVIPYTGGKIDFDSYGYF
jgi:hypothetical protein